MRTSAIAEAKQTAERFLRTIEALEKSGALDDPYCISRFPKESGAARRASLDLTRSLAEMRKP